MKNIFLLMIVFIYFGCASKKNFNEQKISLSGQPTWFPLGGEIVHNEGLASAEEGLLAFKSEPRWFKSFPKTVSRQKYEEWLKENPSIADTQNERGSEFFIPSKLPYPKDFESLQLKDQGASLQFEISNGSIENELLFKLTLFANERTVIREVEHRHTNILPFLFAFYLDGKAIARELNEFNYQTGANSFVDLVPLNQKKEWHLRVDKKSLEKLVGQEGKELVIMVSFSERQHIRYSQDDLVSFDEDPVAIKGHAPQIIIRSNCIKLKRTAEGWAIGGK